MSPAGSAAPVGTLTKGTVSPRRSVPPQIPQPEYVGKQVPESYTGPDAFDQATIERIRAA
ncbi:hypothetical protein [Nesterenkonia pannonica]|uniref:hypothetical protein n=1 Tax=Nesterenkonia pannonica TaxID=1548602 RepID=UPI002164CC4B|nr:hypothetical protein [Nesterenkonia pannonica]